jgi:bifunctional non-homologous end joining protein LigD
VTLYTRSGFDWTNRFATIAADVARLRAGNLVLDGEIICADQDGRPNFSALIPSWTGLNAADFHRALVPPSTGERQLVSSNRRMGSGT